MRTTYPNVPDGASIGPTLALEAAKQVRAWYENPRSDVIDTEAIVTVTRWALHALVQLPPKVQAAVDRACDEVKAAEAYRCAYNGGTCERRACRVAQRCHAQTNAGLVLGDDRLAELAAIQRLAMAAESGEVKAHEACGEIAQRLGHLYSTPERAGWGGPGPQGEG